MKSPYLLVILSLPGLHGSALGVEDQIFLLSYLILSNVKFSAKLYIDAIVLILQIVNDPQFLM